MFATVAPTTSTYYRSKWLQWKWSVRIILINLRHPTLRDPSLEMSQTAPGYFFVYNVYDMAVLYNDRYWHGRETALFSSFFMSLYLQIYQPCGTQEFTSTPLVDQSFQSCGIQYIYIIICLMFFHMFLNIWLSWICLSHLERKKKKNKTKHPRMMV